MRPEPPHAPIHPAFHPLTRLQLRCISKGDAGIAGFLLKTAPRSSFPRVSVYLWVKSYTGICTHLKYPIPWVLTKAPSMHPKPLQGKEHPHRSRRCPWLRTFPTMLVGPVPMGEIKGRCVSFYSNRSESPDPRMEARRVGGVGLRSSGGSGRALSGNHHITPPCLLQHRSKHLNDVTERGLHPLLLCLETLVLGYLPHHDRTAGPFTLSSKVSGCISTFLLGVIQQALVQLCLQAKPAMDAGFAGVNTTWSPTPA